MKKITLYIVERNRTKIINYKLVTCIEVDYDSLTKDLSTVLSFFQIRS